MLSLLSRFGTMALSYVWPKAGYTQWLLKSGFNYSTNKVVDSSTNAIDANLVDSNCLTFDGTNDFLYRPNLWKDLAFVNNNWTWETWIKMDTVNGQTNLIDFSANGVAEGILLMILSGVPKLYMSSTGSSWDIASASTFGVTVDTNWHHVAITRNGSTFEKWYDGASCGTITSSASLACVDRWLAIGANLNSSGVYAAGAFPGKLVGYKFEIGVAKYTAPFTPSWYQEFNADITTPTYSSKYGQGNRISSIAISVDSVDILYTGYQAQANLNGLINGVRDVNYLFNFADNHPTTGHWIKFAFPEQIVITEAKMLMQNRTPYGDGVWQWQGSNDNSGWTNIGNSFLLNQNNTVFTMTELSGNTTAYQYYRMLGVSGNTGSGGWMYQLEFKASGGHRGICLPMSEGGLSGKAYDISGNGYHMGCTNMTLATAWGTLQSTKHNNLRYGFEYYDDDATHADVIRVPLKADGTKITPVIYGTDVSTGATATASAFNSEAPKAIDNSLATYWVTDVSNATLTLNLTATKVVSRVVMYGRPDGQGYLKKVEGSNDGSAWTQIATMNVGITDGVSYYAPVYCDFTNTTSYTWYRFTFDKAPATSYTYLYEFELLTSIYTKISDNPAGNFHNNSETKLQQVALTGWCLTFDGTNDFLWKPAMLPYIGFGTSDFTIQFWAKLSSVSPAYSCFFSFGLTDGIAVYATTTSITLFATSTSGSWDISSGTWTGVTLDTTSWHHIAITRSGNTFTKWFDGVACGTVTSALAISNNNNQLTIGASTDGSGAYSSSALPGQMANFKIDVGTALYTTTFTPTWNQTITANTKVYYPMSEGNGSAISDISGNNKHLVAYNMTLATAWGTTQPIYDWNKKYGFNDGAYMDGSQRLTLANSADLNLGSGDFSLEFWWFPTRDIGGSNYDCFFNTWDTGSPVSYLFGMNTSIGMYNGGGSWKFSGLIPTKNTWNHIKYVRTGATLNFYLNGTPGTPANIGTETLNSEGNGACIGSGRINSNLAGFNLYGVLSGFILKKAGATILELAHNGTVFIDKGGKAIANIGTTTRTLVPAVSSLLDVNGNTLYHASQPAIAHADYGNYWFTFNGIANKKTYAQIVADTGDQILADVATTDKKKNLLTYPAPLTGADLSKTKAYLNQ